VSNAALDARLAGLILLKCETLQRTGSFKFRGACNAVGSLTPSERARGVVAISSGNHARGVAEAARIFGTSATIVMPADAPATKRDGTLSAGATIVSYDRASDDREAIAASIVATTGANLVHPFNDARVIAGQGTAGLEIADDCLALDLRPDAVVVPCGGGGLSSGVGLVVRDRFPAAEMILVEPAGFDDYARSLAAGHPVANASNSGSVMDALMAPSPGPIGFAVNRANRASAISVTDDEALAAVAFAARELRLIVEPGGAAALAALLSGRVPAAGRTIVVVLSGGNIDDAMLQRALG
jgi:threonine dehydratase